MIDGRNIHLDAGRARRVPGKRTLHGLSCLLDSFHSGCVWFSSGFVAPCTADHQHPLLVQCSAMGFLPQWITFVLWMLLIVRGIGFWIQGTVCCCMFWLQSACRHVGVSACHVSFCSVCSCDSYAADCILLVDLYFGRQSSAPFVM